VGVHDTSSGYPVMRCHPVHGRLNDYSCNRTWGSRWLSLVVACQDLNLGPHPYQQNTANRCAKGRSCRSCSTVRVEVSALIASSYVLFHRPRFGHCCEHLPEAATLVDHCAAVYLRMRQAYRCLLALEEPSKFKIGGEVFTVRWSSVTRPARTLIPPTRLSR
jgi:hypothetical protein